MKSVEFSPIVPSCPAPVTTEVDVTRAAYERVLPRAKALPVQSIQRPNVNVPGSILRARRALPRILALRSEIARLPFFELRALDGFDDTSNALLFVEVNREARQRAQRVNVSELVEDCTRVRSVVLLDLQPLVGRGFIDAAHLEAIKDGAGHEDLSRDVLSLAGLAESAKQNPRVVTAITDDEIAYMKHRANALRAALESDDDSMREARELRQRLYSLFMSDYDQLRRAVTYIRWNDGDADTIAPSLFIKRRGREESNAPSDDPTKPNALRGNEPAPEPVFETDPTHPVPQNDPFGRG
jgi:hypothetical protein